MRHEAHAGWTDGWWGDLPLVIGHRGAPLQAPENSLAAVEKAIELGADMVEIDVRRTRDGALVLHHNATSEGRPVRSLSRAELRTNGNGVPPTLGEAAWLSKGRICLDVEIKQSGYEPAALEELCRYLSPADFVVTSFQDRVIDRVKRLCSPVRTGLLVGPGPRDPAEVLTRAEECGADLVVPHYRRSAWPILEHPGRRVPGIVWTVNDPATVGSFLDAGVVGIITDVPEVALAVRSSRRRPDLAEEAA